MSKKSEIASWVKHFRALGATDPEQWASSQVNEQIPQYTRFVFLKAAWRRTVHPPQYTGWIDNVLAHLARNPQQDTGALALRRVLESGADREDIAAIVRNAQIDALSDLLYILDGADEKMFPNAEAPMIDWAFVEIDANGAVKAQLDGLSESVRGVGEEIESIGSSS